MNPHAHEPDQEHAHEHDHEHDPEVLRHRIDMRRQVIEETLSQMDEHAGSERQILEARLRQLEAILGEGNWEHLPPGALAELCAWLDEPVP